MCKGYLENPQIQVYSAGNGLLAGENVKINFGVSAAAAAAAAAAVAAAPLLAPRALILRTNQRLDALSRPTPPYFGHT